TALRLSDQFARGAHNANRIVLVFVDQRTERGTGEIGLEFLGDAAERMHDDFGCDRIRHSRVDCDIHACALLALSVLQTRFPIRSTVALEPEGSQLVDPSSTMTSGPSTLSPAFSDLRSMTGGSTHSPALSRYDR